MKLTDYVIRDHTKCNNQKVSIFVDSQNILYGAKDAEEGGFPFDYEALLSVAVRGRILKNAFAFVVEPVSGSNLDFQFTLKKIGYRVISETPKVSETSIKANVDTHLVTMMLEEARFTDVIVLCSGDEDYISPIQSIKQRYNTKVELISFGHRTSSKLIHIVDEFIDINQYKWIFRRRDNYVYRLLLSFIYGNLHDELKYKKVNMNIQNLKEQLKQLNIPEHELIECFVNVLSGGVR